jgi:hypothetical protein
LDGKHIVFGRIVSGEDVFRAIENLEVNEEDKPIERVFIQHCGELVRKAKPVDQSISDDESIENSEEEDSKMAMEEAGEDEENPYLIGVAPPPEIDAPSHRFLGDGVAVKGNYRVFRRTENETDKQGRKVKGRGGLVHDYLILRNLEMIMWTRKLTQKD